jgi:hypothetical protein
MRWLLSLIVGTCLYLPTLSYTQIIQHQISDDGYARVPLQFAFPYYGRVFTESYMFSNGVVGFLNPTNHFCCDGYNITQPNHPFSFAIMPLQTDLINYGQGRFLTEGTAQYQRYKWENISEYGRPQNLNTFGVEIRPSGYIGVHYEQINIDPWRTVTMGMTGDSSLNQYTLNYSGPGFSRVENVSNITQTTGDMCLVDPLFSPNCVGYAQAYLTQQCGLNALYDPSCPGYTQAYFNQQCSLNPLYDRRCSGYEAAYALANVVSTPTAVVSAPVLQVSTTGTVSVETPVVSDPVVNEVITRPVNATVSVQQTNPQPAAQTAQAEPKAEKKTEAKPVAKPTRAEVKNEVTQTAPVMVDVPMQTQPLMIVDMLFRNMVKKPIQDNNRSYYALIMGSQKTHEEMVDAQYRRERD